MNKFKKISQDIGLLVLTGISGCFHFLLMFCDMRGPTPNSFDGCDMYVRAFYFLIGLHLVVILVGIVDIILVAFGKEKKPLNGHKILWIILTWVILAGISSYALSL